MTRYDRIIFVSLDTCRSDCIPGNPLQLWSDPALTAALSSSCLGWLAERSCFLANTITAAPYTSAAHATIFTGRWPPRHGVHEFFNGPLVAPTIFTWARDAGYRTLMKVDFPIVLGRFLAFDRDIDHYLIEEDGEFLDAVASESHLVAFAHFGGMHVPYGFHNLRFGGAAYRDRVAELEGEIDAPFAIPGDQLVETYRSAEDLELLLRYKRIVEFHYSRGNYERLLGLYAAGVVHFLRHRFEGFLARLLETLEGTSYLLVVFGDHGEDYDPDSYGHHNSISEAVLRVPVMIFGRDVMPGTHVARMRTADIVPTILDRIGAGGALDVDGTSFAPTVWDGQRLADREAFAQAYTSDTAEFIAFQRELLASGEQPGPLRHVLFAEAGYDEAFKLSRRYGRYGGGGGIWGLEGIGKRVTLERIDGFGMLHGADDPAVAGRVAARLTDYGQLVTHDQPRTAPAELRRHLRALGYRL